MVQVIYAAVAGTDYLASVAFSDLTSTPTTIAGYGITDAVEDFADLRCYTHHNLVTELQMHLMVHLVLTSKSLQSAGYGITDAVADFADQAQHPLHLLATELQMLQVVVVIYL